MKILAISDSHGYTQNIADLLEIINQDIDFVLHSGDYCYDINKYKLMYKNIEFYSVKGNCDFDQDYQNEIIIEICGKSILLTHGHKSSVKSGYEKLTYLAEEKSVDICIFGHTHNPVIFELNNIIYINPGSISNPRGVLNNPSYGIIEIDNNLLVISIVEIFGNVVYKVYDSFEKR